MPRSVLLCWLVVAYAAPATVLACPFCTAVKPSLSQRRADADIALLAEARSASGDQVDFNVQKLLSGSELLADRSHVTLPRRGTLGSSEVKQGQLAVVLATRDSSQALGWEIVPLDEVGFAYVMRAPARQLKAVERLPYYAKFLEHKNAWIAEDAYLEFGGASFDDVAVVASSLPQAALRLWIVDPQVPEARQGFYGLALGLAANEHDRTLNKQLLERLIAEPAGDFRAGFDGILGGYLLLAGPAGLKRVDEQLLASPQAKSGDLRHAMTALRFMREFGHGVISDADLNRAMRRLLVRPELAAAAIVDLARWQDWDSVPAVTALFDREGYRDAQTSRAIVGYLLAAPRSLSAAPLAQLRERFPQRVSDAERQVQFAPTSE